ncbi:MAG: hypothetical protein AB8C95_15810 [Phycisphaeraceae bacterium]
MLKFLRKNQKWMLVIFCGALMVAFLIPQAVSQFAPNPAKTVLATTYDGEPIAREEIQRVSNDVQMLRQLRIEALPLLPVIPQTGSERNDALAWIMIQRAAERNGLGAGQQESFNLIATVLGLQDFESLDARAKEMNASASYLIEIGRQYLVAEQYRQLVSGIEYNLPADDAESKSPGVRRVIAMMEANQIVQRLTQDPRQFMQTAMMQGMSPEQFLQQILVEQGFIEKIQGHERFSATELRYALQRQFAEIDLTVVVLDADSRLDTTTVDDAYVKGIFDRYADDQPGTGEPYGLGYREPDKVQLEALRIPIDSVREVVAKTILEEDVRSFYNENRGGFIDLTPPAEGEAPNTGPAKLTMELRDQIRLTLTEIRANELAQKIAQQARLRLNEDARGLPDDGIYKKLPEDFSPMSLPELASEIESEHGVAPEHITVEDFVSSQDMIDASQFTQSWLSQMPTATVKMPDEQFGFMMDIPVPQTVLGGRAGLFATTVPAFAQQRQAIRLADYLTAARPFLDAAELEQASTALQVGLPGEYLRDATGSTYVFRITKVQPARPAPSMAPIAEQVREDAVKVKAYEDLVAEEESLLKTAADQSIEKLMPNADAKSTLTGMTRGSINQRFGARIEGVRSTQPILEQAFQITDDLIASGGFDQASEADRFFVVELPADYKIAIVRIDTFRAMTRDAYEQEASRPQSLMLATNLGATQMPENPLSFEALQRYTGFVWAEGFGPEEEGDEDAAE